MLLSSKRAKALIALIVLAPGQVRARKWLQDKLWSQRGDKQGAASLRQELSSLRKIQAEANFQFIETSQDSISITGSAIEVDLLQGERPSENLDILEGLDINDPEFEEWLRLERAAWQSDSLQSVPERERKAPRGKLQSSAFQRPQLFVDFPQLSKLDDQNQSFIYELYDELLTAFGALNNDINIFEGHGAGATEGSMKLSVTVRQSDSVRVNARLINLADQKSMWSERFEHPEATNTYDCQEFFCRKILEGIQLALTDGQMSIIWSRYSTSIEVWELYQRGRSAEAAHVKRGHQQARGLYQRAIELDPDFLPAQIVLAFLLVDEFRLGWSENPEQDIELASERHQEILKLAPGEPYAHILGAYLQCARGEKAAACRTMDEILSEIPENPELLAYQALLLEANDEMERAIALYKKALEITAFPPNWIRTNLGLALMIAGDELAQGYIEEALSNAPDSVRALIGNTVLAIRRGDMERAKKTADHIKFLQPDFVAEQWRNERFWTNVDAIRKVGGDLKKVGL